MYLVSINIIYQVYIYLSIYHTAIEICYPGEVRLANSMNETFDDDSEYISGYPVICIDNEFVPLCNSTRLGPREIIYICAVSTNFTC